MHGNSSLMRALERLNLNKDEIDRVICRQEKGLIMTFYPDHVFKDYSTVPTYITVEDQTRRLMNELAAYQCFNALKCPFVPKLVDFSTEERWLCISRIHGQDLLKISQTPGNRLPMKSILAQLDEMNIWLRENGLPDTGSNTKDVILSATGQLFLVDFEAYSRNNELDDQSDIYNALIQCVVGRVLFRNGRRPTPNLQFIRLTIGILGKRPKKAIKYAIGCL